MRSLHYPIPLPDDYDMAAIARRVREKAHLFEALPGLRLKAFLARSRADGVAGNAYAPFYVWDDDAAAQSFLRGPLFAGVVESFGRPGVLDRPVLAFAIADPAIVPALATVETIAHAATASPADIARREETLKAEALALPGLFAGAATLDTSTWTTTRVHLWRDAAAVRGVGGDAQRYEVLRVVGPALAGASSAASRA
jgi:hypothetical protein